MKYYPNKLDRKKKKDLLSKLTFFDKVVLLRCGNGSDIVGVISGCKPFVNEYGSKEFATTREVVRSVEKLVRLRIVKRI